MPPSAPQVLVRNIGRWYMEFNDLNGRRRFESDMQYAMSLARAEAERKERMKESPEQRRAKLQKWTNRCSTKMIVNEEDIVQPTKKNHSDDNSSINSSSNEFDEGALIICQTINTANKGYCKQTCRTVSGTCAICICPYEKDDAVVWSSNPKCKHAFHEECLIDWFTKMQDGTPCPCCRQEFTDLSNNISEGKEQREVVNERRQGGSSGRSGSSGRGGRARTGASATSRRLGIPGRDKPIVTLR